MRPLALAATIAFGLAMTGAILNNAEYRRKAIVAFLIALAYAASDELHQSFVSSRQGSGWDVMIDGVGAFFGVALRVRLVKPSSDQDDE